MEGNKWREGEIQPAEPGLPNTQNQIWIKFNFVIEVQKIYRMFPKNTYYTI